MLYNIPPGEIGQRLTAKEVGQILAYESIVDRMEADAMRSAELEAKAREQRSKA